MISLHPKSKARAEVTTFLEATRPIRRELFELISELPVDGPVTLLSQQVEIAEAIREAESCLSHGRTDRQEIREHVARLRTYGDAWVWMLLHPHAIRQVAKNSSTGKDINGQGVAFDQTIAAAGSLVASYGMPVLIADITNVVRVGDLLLVADPEHPTIVECKSSLPAVDHLMQGRIGRQISRAVGIAKYLRGETTKIYGDAYATGIIEPSGQREWHWGEVEETLRAAAEEGLSFRELSPRNYMLAMRSGEEDRALELLADLDKGGSWLISTQSSGRDDLYPPPTAWPVDPHLRFDLSEGTLHAVRLLDQELFAGDHGDGLRIALSDTKFPLEVSLEGEDFRLSGRFIEDALIGNQSVESCIEGIRTFVSQIDFESMDMPQDPSSRPRVHAAKSQRETFGSERGSPPSDHDLLAVADADHSRLPLPDVMLVDRNRAVSLYEIGEVSRRVKEDSTDRE